MAARAGRDLATHARAAYRDEPDLELARVSGYSNLKLLESLHRADPQDRELLLALAEGFAGAALLFAEEAAADACAEGEAAALAASDRVRDFYDRSGRYALLAIELRHRDVRSALERPAAPLADWLRSETDAGDAPALLWLATATAANAAGGTATAARQAGRARALAVRAVELDPTDMYGMGSLIVGIIDASAPARSTAAGDRGEASLQTAVEVSGGHFLLARVERARTLHVVLGERDLFERELRAVLNAPMDLLPGERLLTAGAKRRAERLLDRADFLFGGNDAEGFPYYGCASDVAEVAR